MRHRAIAALVCLAVSVAGACGSSPTAPSSTGTSTAPPAAALPVCAQWATAQRAAGLPAATGTQATYREALYGAGGGVRAVGSKAYAMWFPGTWATASTRRVIVGLHGTDGNAEEDWWFNWKDILTARGWAYVGLTYLSSTGAYDDEPAAYANLKAAIDELRASCDFGSPGMYLVGFSRGSAMTFGVAYLDLKDRKLFAGFGHNSGAWPIGGAMTPTMSGIVTRNERAAYANGRFWMYCGDRDPTFAGGMCPTMENARDFVVAYGGSVGELFHDPAGGHGGLNSNASAQASMFGYFESLR
jgi:predicted esterase